MNLYKNKSTKSSIDSSENDINVQSVRAVVHFNRPNNR